MAIVILAGQFFSQRPNALCSRHSLHAAEYSEVLRQKGRLLDIVSKIQDNYAICLKRLIVPDFQAPEDQRALAHLIQPVAC